jgi:GNAT superfamily N-acetyltransferase
MIISIGQKIKALLALNVATLPDYRGKSLFRILAERIMERGVDEGYTCMIGVLFSFSRTRMTNMAC